MHLPVAIAAKDHRPTRYGTRLVIPGIAQLRGVPHVDPTAIEHGPLLALEDVARHEHLAADHEGQVLAALAHQGAAIMAPGTGMLIVHRRHPSDRPNCTTDSGRPQDTVFGRSAFFIFPATPAPLWVGWGVREVVVMLRRL